MLEQQRYIDVGMNGYVAKSIDVATLKEKIKLQLQK